jgi:hypothetical protein
MAQFMQSVQLSLLLSHLPVKLNTLRFSSTVKKVNG